MIIYKCIFPNGKMYIGQTKRNLNQRIREHLRIANLENEVGYNYPFYRAIRKYGKDNLQWDVIDTASTQEELNSKEMYWIKFFNTYICNDNSNGYNQTIGGESPNGLIHSEETKKRISNSELGENNTNAKLSKEDVLKIVQLSKQNKFSQVELSKQFHTSEGTISRILSGLRWSSVTGIKYCKDDSILFKNNYQECVTTAGCA